MTPPAGNSLFLSSVDTGQLEGHLKDGVVILPGGHTMQLLLFLYLPNRNTIFSENLDLKNPHLVASRAAILYGIANFQQEALQHKK